MRTRVLILPILSLILLLGGCNSTGMGLPHATGWPYEAIVVMEQKHWDSALGEALRDDLEADIPGLPSSEAALVLTEVTPQLFSGMLSYAKNIVMVTVDESRYTKVSLNKEANRWAQNQIVLTLTAPDEASLIEYLKEKPGTMVDLITKVEMNRVFKVLEKTFNTPVQEKVREKFGISLNVPAEMTFHGAEKPNFYWISNNLNSGRTDVLVYSFPYEGPETLNLDYLVSKRDSVLRENMPGSFENSYMATEVRAVDYEPMAHLGKYAGVMRGLWKMVGDMMGGPFVSMTRVDETSNNVIVVESFVFAPETDKRNIMRRGEASIYTLRLPGEFDIPVSESLGSGQKPLNNISDGK